MSMSLLVSQGRNEMVETHLLMDLFGERAQRNLIYF